MEYFWCHNHHLLNSCFTILISLLTLYHVGGGPHGPPLGVISCHSVGDAPTNSKFLDFSQLHPYFHLVKSFFTFFCNFYKKITVKKKFRPKKERFFDENGQKPFFLKNIVIFCFNYVISMLWEFFWGALHVCRSKIGDVENSFHIRHIFESPQPRGCSWRGYATQEADQELKWKLRTISVWEIWVLEFLGPQSWDTSKSPGPIGLTRYFPQYGKSRSE